MNRSSGEGTVLGQGLGPGLGQGLGQGLGTWPLLSSWVADDLQDDWGAQDAVAQVNSSPAATAATGLHHDGLLRGPGAPWSDADLYPGDAALDTPLLRAALVLLYAVLAAAGFTSNVLVCCVVARQSMRKTTAGKMIPRHLYIANLAVADVLICLMALPGTLWWLLQGWAGAPQLGLMTALCRALPGLQCVCAGAAAGTVAAIALDRYRAIVTRAHDATSCRRAVPRVIATIWAAACALAAPLVAFHDVVDVDGVPRCVSQWPAPAPAWRLSYACVRAVLHFLLPALSLCVVHTRISAYLHSRPMQWRRRRSRRTALVLGTVAAVFTFSWLPLTAFQLLVPTPGQHRVMFACCHLLAMSSTLSNPLLYGWLNSHFRREIRAMLPCCCAPRKERHSRTVCKACRARQERALVKELEGRPERLLVAAGVAGAGGVHPTTGFCRTCWRCAGVGTRARPGGHGRGARLFHLQLPDQPDRRGSLTFLTSLTARHSITLLTHLSGGTTGTTTTTSRLDIL